MIDENHDITTGHGTGVGIRLPAYHLSWEGSKDLLHFTLYTIMRFS